MSTRTVGAAAGIDWLRRALNLGRSNPKAIFGGAALLLACVLAFAIAMSLAMAALALATTSSGTASMVLSLVMGAGLMVVMAALMVGYLRLIDAVEAGRPASAAQVFAGFADREATPRAIGFMLALMLAQNLLLGGAVALLAPELGSWYVENMQASIAGATQAPPTSLPNGFGTAMAVMWVLGMFVYGVQAIGLGQIALCGRGFSGACRDGLAGAARNLLPLLVLFVLVIAVALVLAIVLVVLAMLTAALAKVLGAWLVVLVGIPLYIAFVLGLMVVMFGVMYFLWRDVCDDGSMPAPQLDHVIEA